MRWQRHFALVGCVAVSLGFVSKALAGQSQTTGQQTQAIQGTTGSQSQATGQQAKPAQSAKAPGHKTTAQQTTEHQTKTPEQKTTGQQTPGRQTQARRPPAIPAGMRLLSLREGRELVEGIAWTDDEEGLAPDCSHLVHHLYEQAGYSYTYASSMALYRGDGHFFRVRYPHPGDLIVWHGHVGIVVDPKEHSFFSSVSSGTGIQDYRSAYWRARGYARFYRYLTKTRTRSKESMLEASGS